MAGFTARSAFAEVLKGRESHGVAQFLGFFQVVAGTTDITQLELHLATEAVGLGITRGNLGSSVKILHGTLVIFHFRFQKCTTEKRL